MYAEGLLALAKHPAGVGSLERPVARGSAANPVCGDEIELDIDADADRIVAVAHRTRGCAFTVASASLLARSVPGMRVSDAVERAAALRRKLAGSDALPQELSVLEAVRMYPARVRCALLPWDALRWALDPRPAE